MNFYKNHFGMIISSVVAICISLIMATAAIFVAKLEFNPALLIKNWGTAFLVITLTGMIIPLTDMSFALCRKIGLKPETLPHVLVENVYWQSVIHDWPIMFVISYIFAFFVTKAALKIAIASVGDLKTPNSPQNH